jgi:hypothetical protein
MVVYAADAHAHVQRLVSGVKIVIMLEGYITEEQPSVVRVFFLWAKGLIAKDVLIKKNICNTGQTKHSRTRI